jgi:hypothetical protein
MNHFGAACGWIFGLCSSALVAGAGGTATFRLSSPQDGKHVAPGGIVSWSIGVTVSSGDNAGLALALTDLVQADDNPELFDIPPAAGVPPGMERFSRPLGISNPGEGGALTGYIGLQRGGDDARSLVQIGGAQNTFGAAGNLMARQTAAAAGVAQGFEATLASGSFQAPRVPGVYRFSLRNTLANTLDGAEAQGGFWKVTQAETRATAETIQVTVGGAEGPTFVRGDTNGDGIRNISDAVSILGFLFRGAPSVLPCIASADNDGNGRIELTDAVYLLGFLFLGGPPPHAPFPACGRDSRPNALSCASFPACS